MSWPPSVILVIKMPFSGIANSIFFLFDKSKCEKTLLMPWIVVLALVVHSEKKIIGLGLCICEVKGGTRYILRFFLALRTSVLRFSLYMTSCYNSVCPMHSSVLDIGWWWVHSSLTLPLPFPSEGFFSAYEEKIWSMPCHFLLSCWGSCSCRNCFSWIGNRVGSRKMMAQCEERHIQLLWEQKLCSLMLFLCWSEPFRCWQQNFQLRLNLLPLSLDNIWMGSAGFWWGMNQDSICSTASVSGPGVLGVGSCTVLTAVNSLH